MSDFDGKEILLIVSAFHSLNTKNTSKLFFFYYDSLVALISCK